MRVLIGWELGGGLGHLVRLRNIALKLLERGAVVVVTVRPGTDVGLVFGDIRDLGDRFSLVNSPAVDLKNPSSKPIENKETLADLISGFGYNDPELVFKAANIWNSILNRFQPDLIVSDCAPSLNLTARCRIPIVSIGPPFLLPAPGKPLAHIDLRCASVSSDAELREQKVLLAVNSIRKANGLPQYDFCSEILLGDRVFVAAPPKLDRFAGDRSRTHLSRFELVAEHASPAETTDVYLYLPNSGTLARDLVARFGGWGVESRVFTNGGYGFDANGSCKSVFLSRPAKLEEQLRESHIFVHEGGLASTWAGLEADVTQFIFPRDHEKLNNAVLAKNTSPSRVHILSPHVPQALALLTRAALNKKRSSDQGLSEGLGKVHPIEKMLDELMLLVT